MGKNYIESSLKRFLKRKVKITLGVVVSFLITGMVSLGAESTAEEGSTQWHKEQAQKYLAKLGTGITIDKDIAIENVTISSDNAGGIKVTFSDKEIVITKDIISAETGKIIQNSLNLLTGKEISKSDIEGFEEGLKLENKGKTEENNNQITITGEGNIFVNKGILNKRQTASEGAIAVNKGIITHGDQIGQSGEGVKIYNYGVISNTSNYGQYVKVGVGYNYGIISNKGSHGQSAVGKESEIYNYGIISNSGSSGQLVSEENAKAYNYGVIANNSEKGQYITGTNAIGYNYGIISNNAGVGQYNEKGTSYNYGIIINKGNIGQQIGKLSDSNKKIGFNFGIIANKGNQGQFITENGEGYNYGVIANTNTQGQYIGDWCKRL